MFTFQEIQEIDHLSFTPGDVQRFPRIKRVITDSRILKRGDLFVALRGERFDGHNFLNEVFERGAACAVVDELYSPGKSRYPLLFVRDTTKALGDLARMHRRRFNLPVIAVTGSSGKTTTKEMIHRVLKTKYRVLCTEGNFNNHIGVPQTLFRLSSKDEIAVIEMGMNHSGEIQYLCEVAEPTHGVITNIGKAHLEHFKSIKKIAEAKGELFDWLGAKRGTMGFVNLDDPLVFALSAKLKKKKTFSERSSRATIQGKLQRVDKNGCPEFILLNKKTKEFAQVTLPVPGVHNISNALAAATVGSDFGVSPVMVKKALKHFTSVRGRMEVMNISGVTIIDDTYNANPESVLSALKTAASMECSGKRIIVLGDMLELGAASVSEHRKIGKELSKLSFDMVFLTGAFSKDTFEATSVKNKYYFTERSGLSNVLNSAVRKGDVVLVKGSHGMKMHEIVESLLTSFRTIVQSNVNTMVN